MSNIRLIRRAAEIQCRSGSHKVLRRAARARTGFRTDLFSPGDGPGAGRWV